MDSQLKLTTLQQDMLLELYSLISRDSGSENISMESFISEILEFGQAAYMKILIGTMEKNDLLCCNVYVSADNTKVSLN